MQKTRIMLYVTDVDRTVRFWQTYFALPVAETMSLPDGSQNVVLTLNAGTELSLFARSFIATYSPEVLNNVPSLMLFGERFEELHDELPGATEIVDDNGQRAFGFPDPDGTYFAVGQVN
ncbi:VOC family protein [Levilactobacillus fujinensis]|uniref:VOC family protein n=1 Tax=Levilactobacillus fujinensis TaxID=2486024 RepID=A0ABW1TIH2_9LACO|nr:VOC family protein [Levilactobacillus fujinensis]